jgi:hypothetical protein
VFIFPTFLISFIILVIIQIISSRRVQSALFNLIVGITHSHKFAISVIAVLFLPGTIIHELAHLLSAKALFVHTGTIDVLPTFTKEDAQIKMGSAEIGVTDPVRRSIIGIAPIVVGIVLIVSLIWLFGGSLDFRQPDFSWWQALILLYITFVIGNTFVSSAKDLEGVGGVFVTAVSVVAIVCLLLSITGKFTSESLSQMFNFIYTERTQAIFYQATLAMLVPLIANLSILGIFKIFKK